MERRAETTRAEMILARDFGKSISLLIVVIASLLSIHAVFWIPVAAGSYYAVTYRYRRDAARAEDEYHQAARLGKYYDTPSTRY